MSRNRGGHRGLFLRSDKTVSPLLSGPGTLEPLPSVTLVTRLLEKHRDQMGGLLTHQDQIGEVKGTCSHATCSPLLLMLLRASQSGLR